MLFSLHNYSEYWCIVPNLHFPHFPPISFIPLLSARLLSQFSSVQSLSHVRPHESQHSRSPCPSPTPRVHSNSHPSSQWCHPAISSSVIPFSSHLKFFPASGSFQMSQLFASGGQSIGVSASASVLPMNIQDWSPLGWTGWITLQSKGLARVFSSTTVQKHHFFGAQLSSQSNSHIHTLAKLPNLPAFGSTFSTKEKFYFGASSRCCCCLSIAVQEVKTRTQITSQILSGIILNQFLE